MKRLLTLGLGLCLLGGAMVAQDTGGDKNKKNTAKPDKAHKGGKKGKKGSEGSTTPPPK